MSPLQSGKIENLPYSLSRWTDTVAAKWEWFQEQLRQGWMVAFDQRTSLPSRWSLKPEDTLGLIFWTKDPKNLLLDVEKLQPYRVKVHVTVTGWVEVEKGAPSLFEGADLLRKTAKVFGPENVTWRFSPVPILPDVRMRFQAIAAMAADAGVQKVFVSFLQENDRIPETRSRAERSSLLQSFASDAAILKLKVLLCNEDRLLMGQGPFPNLASGVCAPPDDFALPGREVSPSEGCGCGMAVDPFTINESCTMGCQYCYAADSGFAPKKRNTTKGLPIVQG